MIAHDVCPPLPEQRENDLYAAFLAAVDPVNSGLCRDPKESGRVMEDLPALVFTDTGSLRARAPMVRHERQRRIWLEITIEDARVFCLAGAYGVDAFNRQQP